MAKHCPPQTQTDSSYAHQYSRIEQAIKFIQTHFKNQPSLDEIAHAVHLSPSHLQRLFTDWAGVSPKKFTQYLTVEYAKSLLANNVTSLDNAAYQAGLSGTGRLHDLFVTIEGMTPGEYKKGGAELSINYSFYTTPFGQVIAASTHKGVCHLAFEQDETTAINTIKAQFPRATFQCLADPIQQAAVAIFYENWRHIKNIKLHLRGTEFQLKVWQSLLSIPTGQLTTYGKIANAINQSSASRAVGTAVGRNPVAVVIPCHRVIQSSGKLGGYRWGETKKSALIGWEAAKKSPN